MHVRWQKQKTSYWSHKKRNLAIILALKICSNIVLHMLYFMLCWKFLIVLTRERLQSSGLCWLLKLRWMGTRRVQMKGVLTWLVRWACRAGPRDFCSALAALVGPVQNIFFLTLHFFNSFVPIAQHSGQAAVLGRLSLSVCLWFWQRAQDKSWFKDSCRLWNLWQAALTLS